MERLNRRRALWAGLVGTGVVGGLAGGLGGPTAAGAAAPPDGWISVADHGAVGDGSTDDTAAIQATLDQAAAGTPSVSVYFPPGRTYRVTRGLFATGLSDSVVSGYGATLALTGAVPGDPGGGSSVLTATDCHRLQIVGLSVRDTDRTQIYCGVVLRRCTDAAIREVNIRDVMWTGMGVFDSTPGASTNIALTDCVVEGTRFGISSNGTDVRISDNHVAMYWPAKADASQYFDGIMVLSGADRTVVANNTVTECGAAGIYTQDCTNLVVTGNTVAGCKLRGIEVDGSRGGSNPSTAAVGVAITGNAVSGCKGQINLVQARDVTVVGNRTANPNPALDTSCIAVNVGSGKVVVAGNHADQSHPTHSAVYVDPGATDVTIAWNEVSAANPYQAPAGTVITYRSAAGQVKTSGILLAAGGLGVGNNRAASTPGKVVAKMEVFSATGASLGWVPIYQSIA
jgi:parallel beta-helix repeat protein